MTCFLCGGERPDCRCSRVFAENYWRTLSVGYTESLTAFNTRVANAPERRWDDAALQEVDAVIDAAGAKELERRGLNDRMRRTG